MADDAFRPSCVANFRLRFDEALHVAPDLTNPSSVQGLVSAGPLALTQGIIADLAANVVSIARAVTPERPSLLQGAQDGLTQILSIIPKSCTVEMLGYRQAWKWNLTLPFKDFPFDPRVLRAVGVEIHFGTVSASDFALGMAKVTAGPRSSIIRTRDTDGSIRRDTLALIGIMDTMKVVHGEKGSTVHMEGRDLRGLLLDSPLSPRLAATLNLSKNIQEVVAQILSLHPQGGRFTVLATPEEWVGGKLPSPCVQGDLTRVRNGVSGNDPQSTPKADPNAINFWDLITQYCYLVGAIPFFDGPDLFIRPARNIFDLRNRAGNDPRVKTPFAGGGLRYYGQEQLNVRRLVYGRDVSSMEIDRKFGGVTVPTVECVSIDTDSTIRGAGKLITAQWPPATAPRQEQIPIPLLNNKAPKVVPKASAKPGSPQSTRVTPSGDAVQKDILRIPVPGIKSADRLREIAKDLYEEIGRNEVGGQCETKSMSSYGGTNADPDVLRLRPGDAIELAVDASNLQTRPAPISELTDHVRRSFDQEVAAVAQRVGDVGLARVLVASSHGNVQELSRFFRVENVRFDWQLTGLGISFDFKNYIEARFDVTDKAAPVKDTVTPQKQVVPKRPSFSNVRLPGDTNQYVKGPLGTLSLQGPGLPGPSPSTAAEGALAKLSGNTGLNGDGQ